MRTNSAARGLRRPRSGRRWKLGALLAVLLVVIAGSLAIPAGPGDDPVAPAGSSRVSPPPEQKPLRAVKSIEFTVPDTVKFESRSFEAEAGSVYLLEFGATTTKPEGSPGAAVYFGANLACGSPTAGTLRSVGGTQNVRTGEQISIRNQFLLEITESGKHSCRLQVFSPNPHVDAKGTTMEVDTQWTATLAEGLALEAASQERLPRLADPAERVVAFQHDVDIEPKAAPRFDLLSTVHVTTCTEVEGSTEDGQTWCEEQEVDEEGSTATFTYRIDVLDDAGETCDSHVLEEIRAHVDRRTHHRVVHVDRNVELPASTCGDDVRLTVVVENDGSAPLLIHRGSSTLVIVDDV